VISPQVSRFVQIAFLLACALAWAVVGSRGLVNPILLPPITATFRELWLLLREGAFWPDLLVTLSEVMFAFSLAAVGGLATGALVAQSRFGVRVFDPLFSSLYSIPTILLFPMFVLFFGLGQGSKIAMGTTIAFFPITLTTIAGFSGIDPGLLKAARSMGASALQTFWMVRLPAALPIILGGLRLGLILALLAIIGTETIASVAGLGHQIVTFSDSMDTAKMFAYTILVIAIAIAFNAAVTTVERRVQRRFA
jgi:ABC-type nitrate/sulfonate/bicarbonate transport system permease component